MLINLLLFTCIVYTKKMNGIHDLPAQLQIIVHLNLFGMGLLHQHLICVTYAPYHLLERKWISNYDS